MDLSAYISIAAVLDNSGMTPVIRIIDNSAYPAGVAQQIAGILSITQPDGVTDANTDFTHPNIYWNTGALVQASRPLRLANNNKFQNGGYIIAYTVRCPGYTDTLLTKSVVVNYTAPSPVITPAFDNFTPSLKITDATVWGVPGLAFITVVENWQALIRSVSGTNQPLAGAGITFDLAYGGNYYDSAYDINFSAVATYEVPDVSPWVTLMDNIVAPQQTFYAEIPPTLSQLLTSLTAIKSILDASLNNPNYLNLRATYAYAVSLYFHLIERGSVGSLAGLSSYVYQLQTLFNNGVTPTYVNTNGIIPLYNWGGSSGSAAWASITGKPSTKSISWTVGAGGFPVAGAFGITDARLANVPLAQIIMFRGNIFYPSISKASDASNTLTWTDALAGGESVFILIIAV